LGTLVEWGKAREAELIPLMANRVLEMMAELAVGHLLLQGAAIAARRLGELAQSSETERAFYEGKCHAATFFALNVLPGIAAKADSVAQADKSAVAIPDAAFASV
jgi:hypothetical protein